MSFRFNLGKAAKAACLFLQRGGGRMNVMKLGWALVEWCHAHCAEWTPVARGCAPIAVERIGMALAKSPEQIRRQTQESVELNQLDEIFASA